MSDFKPCDSSNVKTVLQNIIDRCGVDKDDAEVYAEELDMMLDNLLNQDFFGTEGQLDPRGDHRD